MYRNRLLTLSLLFEIGRSLTAMTTSPLRMPAASATEPDTTFGILTPGKYCGVAMPTVEACRAQLGFMTWACV